MQNIICINYTIIHLLILQCKISYVSINIIIHLLILQCKISYVSNNTIDAIFGIINTFILFKILRCKFKALFFKNHIIKYNNYMNRGNAIKNRGHSPTSLIYSPRLYFCNFIKNFRSILFSNFRISKFFKC